MILEQMVATGADGTSNSLDNFSQARRAAIAVFSFKQLSKLFATASGSL